MATGLASCSVLWNAHCRYMFCYCWNESPCFFSHYIFKCVSVHTQEIFFIGTESCDLFDDGQICQYRNILQLILIVWQFSWRKNTKKKKLEYLLKVYGAKVSNCYIDLILLMYLMLYIHSISARCRKYESYS